MSIAKTLTEMARAVVYEAGIKTGSGSTFRHSTEDLYAEINSAYVEQQEESITRGFSFYSQEGSLVNLSTGTRPTSENYVTVDWPTGAHAIARVDVLYNGAWLPSLEPIEWENLRDVCPQQASAASQPPTHYSAQQFGSVSGATVSAGKIAIAPFCSTGQYKLSTLPEWTVITSLTDKFLFQSESWFRWTVWNVVARIACRDPRGVTAQRYKISQIERAACEARMGRSIVKQQGGTVNRARRRWG